MRAVHALGFAYYCSVALVSGGEREESWVMTLLQVAGTLFRARLKHVSIHMMTHDPSMSGNFEHVSASRAVAVYV